MFHQFLILIMSDDMEEVKAHRTAALHLLSPF